MLFLFVNYCILIITLLKYLKSVKLLIIHTGISDIIFKLLHLIYIYKKITIY